MDSADRSITRALAAPSRAEVEAALEALSARTGTRIDAVECAVGDATLWGVGIDPSITTASLKAIVSAVNRAHR